MRGTTMIKMQIIMDEKKIRKEGKYTLSKIYATLDNFFVGRLNFQKEISAGSWRMLTHGCISIPRTARIPMIL